jgi:hypothetical protein
MLKWVRIRVMAREKEVVTRDHIRVGMYWSCYTGSYVVWHIRWELVDWVPERRKLQLMRMLIIVKQKGYSYVMEAFYLLQLGLSSIP